MNVRKPVDYSAMFSALNMLMVEALPQMKLYCEIGRLVSGRPEKGAAVAASEYLCRAYSDAPGFSPRNLRRMREFYRTYESTPEVLAQAVTIGWTQNVVILEAGLKIQEQVWYIQAAGQFGWSKLTLTRKIRERVHETIGLDTAADSCYSNSGGGDENDAKETSRAFLQGLRDVKVQRGLQRQGSCGPYLQNLFPSLTGKAGKADDALLFGNPSAVLPGRERDNVAEKPNPRSPARGEGFALRGLCGAISPFGAESKKQELSIRTLELSVDGEVCAPHRDPVYIKESYRVSKMPPAVARAQQDGACWTVKPPPKILAHLLTGWLLAALPLRAIASPLRGSRQYTHWRFTGGARIPAVLPMSNGRTQKLPCGASMWNTPTARSKI